jgi:23S rRNA-intervening sequence protein
MVNHFRDLDVYQGAMSLVMQISALSEEFPGDERYALTDQIRRSSHSVCANLAEAWRKRRYTLYSGLSMTKLFGSSAFGLLKMGGGLLEIT